MFCPNCSMENADTALECRRCHVPFHDEEPAHPAAAAVDAGPGGHASPGAARAEPAHPDPQAAPRPGLAAQAGSRAADGAASSSEDLGEVCRRCETYNPPATRRCTNCGYKLIPDDLPEAAAHSGSPSATHADPGGEELTPPKGLRAELGPHGVAHTREGPPPAFHDTPAEGHPSLSDELSALAISDEDARDAMGESGPIPHHLTEALHDRTPPDGSPAVAAPVRPGRATEKLCASCAAPNPPNAKFCAECGTPFPKPAVAKPAPAPAPAVAAAPPPAAVSHAAFPPPPRPPPPAPPPPAVVVSPELAEAAAAEVSTDPSNRRFRPAGAAVSQLDSTAEQPAVVVADEDHFAEALAGHPDPAHGEHELIADEAVPPPPHFEAELLAEEAPPHAFGDEAHEEPTNVETAQEGAAHQAPEEAFVEEVHEAEVHAPHLLEPLPPYQASVVVERGSNAGTAFLLGHLENTVGGAGAAVELADDPHLAERHASILFEDQRLLLRDEGAANGVFLKVKEAAPLQPGDLFIAGERLLRFDGPIELPLGEESDTPFQGAPRPPPGTVRVSEVLAGGKTGRTCHRSGPMIAVGKMGCDLNFPADGLLAPRHAEIHLAEDGSATLVDVGGLGVLLRLHPQATHELAAGDLLQVGGQLLRIEVGLRGR